MAWSSAGLSVGVVSFALVAAIGCGGGGDSSGGSGGTATGGAGGSATGGTGGSGTGGSATGGTSGSGGGASCPGPGYASAESKHAIDLLTGKVVDLAGKPAGGMLAQVCGLDICINGSTDSQGNVVTCDNSVPPICATGISPGAEPINRAAFKYGDGFGFVKFAYLLPTGQSTYDIGTMTTAALPPMTEGVAMTAGSDASSAGVVLSVPAGGTIKIDKLTYTTEEEQRFRAAAIPMAQAPEAVDKAAGFEILIGTTPIDTHFCPEAKLSVPNTAGWAADTPVEFWVHGVDPAEEWAPYAGWAKVSDGKVSSDGKSVVTDDGDGVPLLSVFGMKKK